MFSLPVFSACVFEFVARNIVAGLTICVTVISIGIINLCIIENKIYQNKIDVLYDIENIYYEKEKNIEIVITDSSSSEEEECEDDDEEWEDREDGDSVKKNCEDDDEEWEDWEDGDIEEAIVKVVSDPEVDVETGIVNDDSAEMVGDLVLSEEEELWNREREILDKLLCDRECEIWQARKDLFNELNELAKTETEEAETEDVVSDADPEADVETGMGIAEENSTCLPNPKNSLLRNLTTQLESAMNEIKEYTKQTQQTGGEGNFSSDECCICYEMIGTKNNCTTDCGHSFCLTCIATSIRKNVLCPICRQNIIEESDDEEEDEDEEDDDDEYDDDDDDEEDSDDDYEGFDDDEGNANRLFRKSEKKGSVTEIARRFQEKGISYNDLISLYYHRGDTIAINDPAELYKKINYLYGITSDITQELDDEIIEQNLFAKEDEREISRNKAHDEIVHDEVRAEINNIIERIIYSEEHNNELLENILE